MYSALISGSEGGYAMNCVGHAYVVHNWLRVGAGVLLVLLSGMLAHRVLRAHHRAAWFVTWAVALLAMVIVAILIANTTPSDCVIL
jgi:hypothetical protein